MSVGFVVFLVIFSFVCGVILGVLAGVFGLAVLAIRAESKRHKKHEEALNEVFATLQARKGGPVG